jgi:uncharacterized Fe-S cluster protein YjdI
MSTSIEPDASAGGAGAPPPKDKANQARPGLTREYARPEVRVQWYASRCIHSAECVRALPAVFDPRRRPWIDLNAVNDIDAIAQAVVRCPTGALQYERFDGGANESSPPGVQITPVKNGPNLVRGAVDVVDADGQTRRETRLALCRCGQSKHMPLCDNTHRAIGFRSNP